MKMIRRALTAACFLLAWSAAAHAASTCVVREYSQLPSTGPLANIAAEPGADQSPVDFTSGHAESSAFASTTKYLRVICNAQASYAIDLAPVAVNTNSWIPSSLPEYFGVKGGQKISFVANP